MITDGQISITINQKNSTNCSQISEISHELKQQILGALHNLEEHINQELDSGSIDSLLGIHSNGHSNNGLHTVCVNGSKPTENNSEPKPTNGMQCVLNGHNFTLTGSV